MAGSAEAGRAEELAFFSECLQRGYEVFDAVSPACSADCVVNGRRVQVKKLRKDGRLSCLRGGRRTGKGPRYTKADCDVIVARQRRSNQWVLYPVNFIVRDTATTEDLVGCWNDWSILENAKNPT